MKWLQLYFYEANNFVKRVYFSHEEAVFSGWFTFDVKMMFLLMKDILILIMVIIIYAY